MRARTMAILAILVVVLAGIAWLTSRTERSRERLATGPIFSALRWEEVAEIAIAAEDASVRLRRQDGRWLVASDDDYPADTLLVNDIREKLSKLDRRHLISRNPEMQGTFEVADTSGMLVRLHSAGGQTLADFRIGKNGPDFRSQYIRPSGSPEVYLIPDYLRSTFDADRASWRDRAILSFDREKVRRLVFHPEGGDAVTVEKNDAGEFAITSPSAQPAKRSAIDSALRTLAALRCDAFPDSVVSAAAAGLIPPRQRVEVHLDDGSSLALNMGGDVEPARVYVGKDGDPTVFLLSKGRTKTICPDLETLREEAAPAPADPS